VREWLSAHLFYICIILCVCVRVLAPVDLFACLLTVLCIVCIAKRINNTLINTQGRLKNATAFRSVLAVL